VTCEQRLTLTVENKAVENEGGVFAETTILKE